MVVPMKPIPRLAVNGDFAPRPFPDRERTRGLGPVGTAVNPPEKSDFETMLWKFLPKSLHLRRAEAVSRE